MTVPHCPECKRADKVKTRSGNGYEYYCNNCFNVILPDEIVEAAFIDMVKDSMFKNPEKVKSNAEFEYSEKCECDYCSKGRPGLDELKEKF
jgi:hypothetical protein